MESEAAVRERDERGRRSEPRSERQSRVSSRHRSRSRSRPSSRTHSSRHSFRDDDARSSRGERHHHHHREEGFRSRSRSRSRSRGSRRTRRSRSRSQGRRRSRSLDRHAHRSRSRRHGDRSRSRSRSRRRVKRRSVSLDRLDGPRKRASDGAGSDRRSASWNGESSRRSEYRSRDHHEWDDRHHRQRRSRSRDRSNGRPAPRRRQRRGRRGGRRQREQMQREQERLQQQQQQRNGSSEKQVAENGDSNGEPADASQLQQHEQQQRSPQSHNHNDRRGGRQPKRRNKISIPENWEDVAKMGELIRDSRFLPMRCPLDDKFTHLYESPEHEWSPKLFLQEQESKGHNVRMIIDLTNTFKYYDGIAEFENTPVEYFKLKIEGFNAPPREDEVNKFIGIVDEFLEKVPEGNIAVHCTHGLNRTGYLIVSYLVKKLGCTVKHALESFSLARPPGLIKHMYVEALYRNLGEGEEVELPVLPDWAAEKYSRRV